MQKNYSKENIELNLEQVNKLIDITQKEIIELEKEIEEKNKYLIELISYLENK